MAQETQQEEIHQNGSNDHGQDDIKSLFDKEYKQRLEERSKISIYNCFTRILKAYKKETRDSASARNEENDVDHHHRKVTESNLSRHDIHGFENEVMALKNFLLKKDGRDDEFKALAVVGKPGVGKTALCQMIFNDENVIERFVPRIWVSMFGEGKEDENPKIAIVKRILENLGVDEEMFEYIQTKAKDEQAQEERNKEKVGEGTAKDKELSRLLYALHLHLWGKKFLIVLDDVCESDGWDERLDGKKPEAKKWGTHISCGFPIGSGGRIIFNSRNEKLAEKLVGEDNLHRLYPLSDVESCWSIYLDAVRENVARDPRKRNEEILKKIEGNGKNLKKCKDDLMNKTGGVPLAARMMEKILPQEYEPPPVLQEFNQTNTDMNTTDQTNINE